MKLLENGVQRRSRLDLNTEIELQIRECVTSVEVLGADPLLTDAVNLLQEAREKVADWIENQPDFVIYPRGGGKTTKHNLLSIRKLSS